MDLLNNSATLANTEEAIALAIIKATPVGSFKSTDCKSIFNREDCLKGQARSLCTKTKDQVRRLRLQPQAQYKALQAALQLQATEAGKKLYNKRAGVEGTISQGVRAFGLRKARYYGLAKTHLQHQATAAAMNLDRLHAWFNNIALSKTPISRFARLAPLAT